MLQALIPLALVGAGVYFLRQKASSAQNLQIDVQDIAIDSEATKNSWFAKLFYQVKLQVTNPDQAAVTIKAVNLDVYVNGQKLGRLQKLDSITIPPRSQLNVAVTANIATLSVLTAVKDYFLGSGELIMKISGFVDTDLGRVTLKDQTVNF